MYMGIYVYCVCSFLLPLLFFLIGSAAHCAFIYVHMCVCAYTYVPYVFVYTVFVMFCIIVIAIVVARENLQCTPRLIFDLLEN